VTDAARFYLDTNLATGGLRDWALDDFEIFTWLADLNGFHGGPLSEEVEAKKGSNVAKLWIGIGVARMQQLLAKTNQLC
jgi:hypothetical protein